MLFFHASHRMPSALRTAAFAPSAYLPDKTCKGAYSGIQAALSASGKAIRQNHFLNDIKTPASVHATNVHDLMHRKQVTDEMQLE